MKKLISLTVALTINIFCMTAHGNITYDFSHIAEDGDGPAELLNGTIGESQMHVNVSDAGGNNILFNFTNSGPFASSITDVYFDDNNLFSSMILINNSDPGVSFSRYAKPSDLPGGNNLTIPFVATTGLTMDSDPPVQPNGVNPGEFLGVTIALQNGKAYDDVIGDLATGDLRIGIRVQGFANCGSEAFVNTNVVPAPGAFSLAGLGAALIGWIRRRKTL